MHEVKKSVVWTWALMAALVVVDVAVLVLLIYRIGD